MPQEQYHQSITVFPNGTIVAGEHEEGQPLGAKILGKATKIRKNIQTGLYAKSRVTPNNEMSALSASIDNSRQYTTTTQYLSATTNIANASNLTHLQLIRLYPEAQGVPIDYFWLDNMFVSRDIPQLEFRETFYDTTDTSEYLGRLESSKSTETKYDEIDYNLRKLVDKVYTPIEDIFRTIINPLEIDLAQIRWGMKRKRNREALEEGLKKIGNTQSEIGNFAAIGSNYHSVNRSASELNDLFVQFLRDEDVPITHVAMNNSLFAQYTENTWTKSGPADLNPQRLSNGGVVPLPGFSDGKMAVIDNTIPDNTIFAVNKENALRLGEGPKIMRRYYDEEKDAEAIKILDFNQYIAVADQLTKITRKFGMTIPVAAS